MIHPGLICWYQIESIYNISHWYQIVYNIEHIISTSGLLYTYVIYIYIYYTYKWCIYTYIYILYIFIRNIYIYIYHYNISTYYVYIYIHLTLSLTYFPLALTHPWHLQRCACVASVFCRFGGDSKAFGRWLTWPVRKKMRESSEKDKDMGIYGDL